MKLRTNCPNNLLMTDSSSRLTRLRPTNLSTFGKRENPDDQFNQHHPARFPFNCRRAGCVRCCRHPGQRCHCVRDRSDIDGTKAHRAARLAFENAPAGVLRLSRNCRAKNPGHGSRFGKKRLWKPTIRDGSTACGRSTAPPMPQPTPLTPWQTSLRPRWREWWGCCNTPSASGPRNGRKAWSPMTTPRPGHGITFLIEMLIAVLPGMAVQS